jgi:hypothetical protein
VAADIWTAQNATKAPGSAHSKPVGEDVSPILAHPMYTAPDIPSTGVGELIYPLNMPGYDQATPSREASGLPNHWTDVDFDAGHPQPIGEYPVLARQWTSLRDPHTYWDKQGAREYGQVLQDHDTFTDAMGIDHEEHWSVLLRPWAWTFGTITLMSVLVGMWDPSAHKPAVCIACHLPSLLQVDSPNASYNNRLTVITHSRGCEWSWAETLRTRLTLPWPPATSSEPLVASPSSLHAPHPSPPPYPMPLFTVILSRICSCWRDVWGFPFPLTSDTSRPSSDRVHSRTQPASTRTRTTT